MEKVDIVDENNKVLYQTTKKQAHKKGLLHRTIIAELINSMGRWILVKQAIDRQDAGQYVSPVGGHMKAGESETEALKRETSEELEIKKFAYKRIRQVIYNRLILDRQENHYFIIYEIYSDQEPILNNESTSFKRFTKNELKKIIKTNPKNFGDAFYSVIKSFYPSLLRD